MSFEIRAQKKKRQPSLMITSLPNDIIIDISARVPRCEYPTLSLVSKHFHSLVASHELYARRSFLGCTECCLYVVTKNSLHILRQKADNNNRLVRIQPLPLMLSNPSFVAVDSRIYALSYQEKTSSFLSIDCRSHTVHPLPSMPMPMVGTIAGTIGGNIYVIGYINIDSKKKFMVIFNTETQMWEHEITKLDMEIGYLDYRCVVMTDKIYMRDSQNSFVYDPKENKLETDMVLNSNKWKDPCVVDDVLYYYDCYEYKLKVYDPKERRWGVVKGLERFMPEFYPYWLRTVTYGGNLVVLFGHSGKEIWCAEIVLERGQGKEEIWGKVKWHDVVFNGLFSRIHSLAVMI